MAIYDKFRDTAIRLVTKYGTVATMKHKTVVAVPNSSYKSTVTEVDTAIKCIIFDDDGTLFVNHNIQGHTRILVVAPDPALTEIHIGDTVTLPTNEVVQIKQYKDINPDLSGVILWALLIV